MAVCRTENLAQRPATGFFHRILYRGLKCVFPPTILFVDGGAMKTRSGMLDMTLDTPAAVTGTTFANLGWDNMAFSTGLGFRFIIPQFPFRFYFVKRFTFDGEDILFSFSDRNEYGLGRHYLAAAYSSTWHPSDMAAYSSTWRASDQKTQYADYPAEFSSGGSDRYRPLAHTYCASAAEQDRQCVRQQR